jgi:hypothetical protein
MRRPPSRPAPPLARYLGHANNHHGRGTDRHNGSNYSHRCDNNLVRFHAAPMLSFRCGVVAGLLVSAAMPPVVVVVPPIVLVVPPAMPPTVADPIDRLNCPLIRDSSVFRLINQRCRCRRFRWSSAQQWKREQSRSQKPYHVFLRPLSTRAYLLSWFPVVSAGLGRRVWLESQVQSRDDDRVWCQQSPQ